MINQMSVRCMMLMTIEKVLRVPLRSQSFEHPVSSTSSDQRRVPDEKHAEVNLGHGLIRDSLRLTKVMVR